MRQWQIERGIGEDRALLIADGEPVAARLDVHGGLRAGQVLDAVLVARAAGARRGTVRTPEGEEALVDQLPPAASEGAPLRVRITRPALSETGRDKRAQCRPTTAAPRPAPTLAETLAETGTPARIVRALPAGLWEDTFARAWSARADFAQGSLALFPTPAMTLVDIDGTLPPRALALAAVPELARTIALLDLAGNIGVDFPTLPEKPDRRAVDAALTNALAHWRHERTAMNGFGFVQLVARLERPSLLATVARDRPAAAARLLLRQAEAIAAPGPLLLTAHPRVLAAIEPAAEAELARRTGRPIRRSVDATLALDAGFAQAVAP
jgi:hypothetical protein